jgi:hypothetical protein
LIIIPVATVIINKTIPLIAKDIEDFNSFSTRATTWVASFKSLFLYPLGEGYGTYLVYYPPMLLPTNTQIMHFTGFPLVNIELTDMVETGRYLPGKSGITNEVVYNGFIAVLFVWYVCSYYVKHVKVIANNTAKQIFSFLGILMLIVFLFNSVLETSYFYLIPFVVLFKLGNKNHLETA